MRVARPARELDAKAVLALKPGDTVWLIGGYSSSTPKNIATVVRTTNTLVIVTVDHSEHGGPTASEHKFTRLPNQYGGVGYESPSRSFGDRLHSFATPAEVAERQGMLANKARARAAHEKAELDREETRKLLNELLPQSCYAQVESTGLINVQVTNLKNVEQVQKLAVLLEKFLTDRPTRKS